MPSAATVALARGFHAVATPLSASTAAMFGRDLPPIALKPPPTTTRSPLTANAEMLNTRPPSFGSGSQAAMAAVRVSSAARLPRGRPPALSNDPPT